jgi:hypothetical protein
MLQGLLEGLNSRLTFSLFNALFARRNVTLALILAFENCAITLAFCTSRVAFRFTRRRACAALRRAASSRLRAISRGESRGRGAETAGATYTGV